ncbi:MAG: aminotransferase class V-fold PLP-dependent enzyme [Bacteroidota bacterium]|nr:aminotransferase class V-fold PLP-dependent enzyme [Bacteroidota bacterium]MDP4247521.1 aminotransferase class V-fold PLP-dependent enzyme [Bacteroidota bacterium]MDP4254674.1 aminotransferase class V-fold PLP-dependent enzyme [Bacteroidota bacterium]MDP4260267.1 aminotransferase class V-fold PLP-dependent enzyme [Bacteroidota bacterium]
MDPAITLETYFSAFRANIIGQQQYYDTPFGSKRILYADWTASGRAYRPIEEELLDRVLPFFGNTHTESTVTGRTMTAAYEGAKRIIREHVHAGEGDVMMFCGSGMTSGVNKLQRMLGLKGSPPIREEDRPLVVVTHMEHHSNQISWLETMATVEVIQPDCHGGVDLENLRELLERYRERRLKIAAVTACSNVTGIRTPYHEIARIMHQWGGVCCVDFACSAPYVDIDMHPGGKGPGRGGVGADLDAIYFSVHKFLGGPGTPGVLVFNRKLYGSGVPDQPGGGTLLYSNPWGGREYVGNIEAREEGGTPPILQGIKAGLCIRLKEEMGAERMLEREGMIVGRLMERLVSTPGVVVLAADNRERLGVLSFIVEGMHYDSVVKSLNDRFGIQARGGCSCAGTYGHYLLHIDQVRSGAIRAALLRGEIQSKPGWVRLSLHPTMTDEEIDYIADAVERVAAPGPTETPPGIYASEM